MENVLSINNTNSDTVITTTTAIAETAPYIGGQTTTGTGFTYTDGTTYTVPSTWTTNSYSVDLQVKRAVNGYVITFQYSTYVAKNEKELNKLIVQLLNPNKGKKHGKKV